MPIFEKECPQCTTGNSAEAVFCRCGYCFDPTKLNSAADTLKFIDHEERLYLEYLSARLAQTERDLAAAEQQLARDPGDTGRAADVLLATQALNGARAEYDEQVAKLRAAHAVAAKGARAKPATAKAAKPAKAAAATKTNAAVKAEARPAKKAPATAPVASASAAAPHKPKTAAFTPPKPVAAKVVAPVAPAPVAKKRAAAPTVAPVAAPVVTSAPGESFRAEQAAKAARIVPPAPSHPVVAAGVGTTPAQTAKAAGRDCPNCMAVVANHSQKCRCGFDFTARFEMPALVLSAEDRAMFANLTLTGT